MELSWCQAIGKVLFPSREWGTKKSSARTAVVQSSGTIEVGSNEQHIQSRPVGPSVADRNAPSRAEEEKTEVQAGADDDGLKNERV